MTTTIFDRQVSRLATDEGSHGLTRMPKSAQKNFVCTFGRGLQMRLPNGYIVSIQFGTSNYCSNRTLEVGKAVTIDGLSFVVTDLAAGARGSETCETAIMTPDGEYVPYDRDRGFFTSFDEDEDRSLYYYHANMTPKDVFALIIAAASLPAA